MKKAILLVSYVLIVAVVIAAWAWNHVHAPLGNLFDDDRASLLLTLGRLTGLLGVCLLLAHFLFISRTRWLEQQFGLDRLTRYHHWNGFLIVALLLSHPILLTWSYAERNEVTWGAQFLDFLKTWDDVLPALIGLILFWGASLGALRWIRQRFRYEIWHTGHLSGYIAIGLTIGHQFNVGGDFTSHPWFRYFWMALYGFTGAHLAWYRVIKPLTGWNKLKVSALETETHDVTSVFISGPGVARLNVIPGQFVIVRFLAKGFWLEPHPFTVSSIVNGDTLRLSIKQVGDFTQKIPTIPVGTNVLIDGPHGIFTVKRSSRDKFLLIAGGIGITPIRVLAEAIAHSSRDVVILYGNRQARDVVFNHELEQLVEIHPKHFRIHHVLSEEPEFQGEKGFISGDIIQKLVPDYLDRSVFMCGPPPMMKSLLKVLYKMGISRSDVYYERFAL